MNSKIKSKMIEIGKELALKTDKLKFSDPVKFIYNPLIYAWNPYEEYLNKYGSSKKKAMFLGMNPGPWGMAQTGIPFGDVSMVNDWLKISGKVNKPLQTHSKKPIDGFDCSRSEVSGTRLWGYFMERFKSADNFFKDYFVENYCPLIFLEEGGRNRTPDKLSAKEKESLIKVCDVALRKRVVALEADIVVGIGAYAEKQAKQALKGLNVKIARILHPSPASPIANRGWAKQAHTQLIELGL